MRLTKRSGFTLLEIIIVIIIVGVLASLALPRFFATIEFSRSTEALQNAATLRQSIERCYLGNGGTYAGCTVGTLDVADPSVSPGTHFTYLVSGQTATDYTIEMRRNAFEGSNAGDQIFVTQGPAGVTRAGTGAYVGIQ